MAPWIPRVLWGGVIVTRTLFFELLGSQMTHWNEPILYGKVLSWGFQKVQDHFGGWSESWAIRDQNWSILSWKTPNFQGGKNHDLKKLYFIFYKFNQGSVFCKHPSFLRIKKNLIFFVKFTQKKKSYSLPNWSEGIKNFKLNPIWNFYMQNVKNVWKINFLELLQLTKSYHF